MKGCEIREKRSRTTVSGLTKNNCAEEKGSKRKNITTHTSQLSKRAKKRREKAATREQENFSKDWSHKPVLRFGFLFNSGGPVWSERSWEDVRITCKMQRWKNPSWLP